LVFLPSLCDGFPVPTRRKTQLFSFSPEPPGYVLWPLIFSPPHYWRFGLARAVSRTESLLIQHCLLYGPIEAIFSSSFLFRSRQPFLYADLPCNHGCSTGHLFLIFLPAGRHPAASCVIVPPPGGFPPLYFLPIFVSPKKTSLHTINSPPACVDLFPSSPTCFRPTRCGYPIPPTAQS